MKRRNHTTPAQKQLIWAAGLFLFILLLIALRQNPLWIEKYYYNGLYQVICHVLRPVFGFIPFSVGDLLYTVVIFLLIAGALELIYFVFTEKFKRVGQLLLRFFIALEIAWIWFYCFWGLNYYRPPAADLLGLNDTSYTIKNVDSVTARLIDSANAYRASLDTFTFHQSNADIYRNAVEAVKKQSGTAPEFRVISPGIKPSWFSYLLNYIGTSGYYNPFTTESQMNYMMPVFDKPFIASHELSHQTGFAREDEADFAGFVAGINADDHLQRYSAYYAGVGEFMRYLRRRDTLAHQQLRLKISPQVMDDFKADSAYWTKYEGNAERMSGIFYDNFLKANNQPHGLRTYNRMILLTMAYYRKKYHAW